MKKETLEEAVQRITDNWFNRFNSLETELVEEGIKWQQERSYSEEEVFKLLLNIKRVNIYYEDVEKWFQQFKKK